MGIRITVIVEEASNNPERFIEDMININDISHLTLMVQTFKPQATIDLVAAAIKVTKQNNVGLCLNFSSRSLFEIFDDVECKRKLKTLLKQNNGN